MICVRLITVADIPGLIEGAHLNRGLGFSFLRHIERCPCIVYIVDLSSSRSSPVDQLATLWNELDMFHAGLSRRPSVVIGNKVDLPGARQRAEMMQDFLVDNNAAGNAPFLAISAKHSENIDALLRLLREMYDKYRAPRST